MGGDGCIAATIKCCCSLFHGEIPPSNTPGCGCGPMMCGGNLDRDASELGPSEQEELELLKTTCLWANLETDTCCDDGWIENTSKVCCCVVDASYPAGRTPGVVCCGQTLCMQQGLDAAATNSPKE